MSSRGRKKRIVTKTRSFSEILKSWNNCGATFVSWLKEEENVLRQICNYFYDNFPCNEAVEQFKKDHKFKSDHSDSDFMLYVMAYIRAFELQDNLDKVDQFNIEDNIDTFINIDKYSQLKGLPKFIWLTFARDYLQIKKYELVSKYKDVNLKKWNNISKLSTVNTIVRKWESGSRSRKRKRNQMQNSSTQIDDNNQPKKKRRRLTVKNQKEYKITLKFFTNKKDQISNFNTKIDGKITNVNSLKSKPLVEILKNLYNFNLPDLFSTAEEAIEEKYDVDVEKIKKLNENLRLTQENFFTTNQSNFNEIITLLKHNYSWKSEQCKENIQTLSAIFDSFNKDQEEMKKNDQIIKELKNVSKETIKKFTRMYQKENPLTFNITQKSVEGIVYKNVKETVFQYVDDEIQVLKKEKNSKTTKMNKEQKKLEQELEELQDKFNNENLGLCESCKTHCSSLDVITGDTCNHTICIKCIIFKEKDVCCKQCETKLFEDPYFNILYFDDLNTMV